MNRNQTFRHLLGALLVLALGFGCLLPDALAQFTGRSSSGTGSNSAGGTGSRQYFNNTMLGDALIEFDIETRSIIVIADEETNLQIERSDRGVRQAEIPGVDQGRLRRVDP